MMTCSTWSASTPARRRASWTARTPSSTGGTSLRPPRNRPIGGLTPPPPPAPGSAERRWEDAPRAPVSDEPPRASATGQAPRSKGGLMFVGIDWAKDSHDVCAVDPGGKICGRATVAHSQGGFDELASRLERGTREGEVLVGIERPEGRLGGRILAGGYP